VDSGLKSRPIFTLEYDHRPEAVAGVLTFFLSFLLFSIPFFLDWLFALAALDRTLCWADFGRFSNILLHFARLQKSGGVALSNWFLCLQLSSGNGLWAMWHETTMTMKWPYFA
jgi:hypothetical protein